MSSSCFVIEDRYGLTNRGASTWPRKILAVALRPTGPPTFKGFLNNTDMNRTIIGIIFQCHTTAERAEITITRGKTPNAKIGMLSGLEISKGAPGDPGAK